MGDGGRKRSGVGGGAGICVWVGVVGLVDGRGEGKAKARRVGGMGPSRDMRPDTVLDLEDCGESGGVVLGGKEERDLFLMVGIVGISDQKGDSY